jgi:TolA-binding protein
MKKLITVITLLSISCWVAAQSLTQPPSGDNQKAGVTQFIGPVSVNINYSSPDVTDGSGQDRKGHIWGELVPYGLNNLGFGTSAAAPWRGGANENTTITFSHAVKINGKDLKAGTYGLHIIVEKDKPWTFIFSNNSSSWGSFFYNDKEDALRAESTPVNCEFTRYLTYGFDNREASSATAFIQWENKRASFSIEVPTINDIYLMAMRNELRGSTGFNYQNLQAAAQFCVQNKTNLEEGLQWAEAAVSAPFIGQEDFNTLQTKSNVLAAMGKEAEADAVMNKAIKHPTANVGAIHQYGRTLLAAGKKEKAMEIFQYNFKTHPEEKFTPNVGLARAYTAMGDKKNAIKYWEVAIKNIPENQKGNTALYEAELKKLREGK